VISFAGALYLSRAILLPPGIKVVHGFAFVHSINPSNSNSLQLRMFLLALTRQDDVLPLFMWIIASLV
jgi:hypothetical protein